MDFALRGPTAGDIAFIFDCWLDQTRHAPISKHVPTKIYRPNHHKLVENILKVSNVLIACNPEEGQEFQIFGFVVYQPNPLVFHWIYVKDLGGNRKQGLARALMEHIVPTLGTPAQPELVCTHSGEKLFQDRDLVAKYKLIFNPYLLKDI
jgi:hypothetical protein